MTKFAAMRFLRSYVPSTSRSAVLAAAILLLAIPDRAALANWHGGGDGWHGGWHGWHGGWHGGGGWGWHRGTWGCCWRGGVFVGVVPPPVYYPPPYGYGY